MNDIKEETAFKAEITGILAANYDIGEIRSFMRLTGGYGGDTYFIQSSKGAYIFRDIEQNGMNHPENEALIADTLKGCGIPVPEIIAARDGAYLLLSQGRTYQLRAFAEGRIHKNNTAPAWLLLDSARMLGLIQQCLQKLPPLPAGLCQDYFTYFTPERAENLHRNTLERAMAKGDADIANAVAEKITMLQSLKGTVMDMEKLTLKNTHGDYKIQHFICQKDKISAIIDFTGACYHPICFELIRSYTFAAPECAEGTVDIDNLKKYIASYAEFGALSEADLKSMTMLFYYQNVVADYFGQYYAMEYEGRHILLQDAFFSLKLCRWLERNMTKIEDTLTRGL
jgi:Ser/Thr protein kinase RdoA (MazF antagonist)